jgi:hypothetical protein
MINRKDVKKFLVFSTLGLFMISMMTGVLAQTSVAIPAPAAPGQTGASVAAFFTGLINGFAGIGQNPNLFIVLFAILLAMVVYSVTDTIFKTNWFIRSVATAVITALGVFAIPADFLQIITTQYGVMGATILTAIPFAIVVFFTLKSDNELISKITWVFFIMYYFAILITELIRVAVLNTTATTATFLTAVFTTTLLFQPAILPYTIALIAGILMLLFLSRFREFFFRSVLSSKANKLRQKKAELREAARVQYEDAKAELEGTAA